MLSCMVPSFKTLRGTLSVLQNKRQLHLGPNKMVLDITRWAFRPSNWNPTEEQLLAVSSFIQPEEKERISKFYFIDDAKSSLIGRLLMRKFVHVVSSMPYEDICFGRDERGKPTLLGCGETPLSFNVSHQGDFVVLAGCTTREVGVDIMRVEPPVNKNIPEFFRLMNRQFSDHEWSTVKSFPTEMEQIACFYRLWSLKESYVKNIGVGITVPLKDISFHIKTMKIAIGEVVKDTVLYQNGVLLEDYVFEESLLGDSYTVSIAIKVQPGDAPKSELFTILTYEELVEGAKPLFEADAVFKDSMMTKETKNF